MAVILTPVFESYGMQFQNHQQVQEEYLWRLEELHDQLNDGELCIEQYRLKVNSVVTAYNYYIAITPCDSEWEE